MGHFWMVLGVQRKLCTRAARCLTSEPCTALNLKFSDATQNQIGSGVSSLNEIERHTSSLALASKCPPGGNFGFRSIAGPSGTGPSWVAKSSPTTTFFKLKVL